MSSYAPIQFKAFLIRGAVALTLIICLSASFGSKAGDHYISLSKIFPVGKCSSVIPNFEVMISQFAGGELTEHKIHNDQGEVIEVSVANSYSRGDREFEKATAMLFPSEVAQRGRMREHAAAPFRRRVTV